MLIKFKRPYTKNDEVKEIQTLLNGAGYKVAIDSEYGPETEGAVRRFQNDKKLRIDGIVGVITYDALKAAQPKATIPAIPAAVPTIKQTEFADDRATKIGCLYVSGAQGQTMTEKLINVLEKNVINRARAMKQFLLHVKNNLPLVAYDCSGLVMEFIQNMKHYISHDYNANGIYYDLCTSVTVQDLMKGDLVFIKDTIGKRMHHVGVYGGDGTVVESRGRKYGVVKTAFTSKRWTNYGRLKCLQ